MAENHTLRLDTRTFAVTSRSSTTVADGSCTCGKWVMRNRIKTDIREGHAAHVLVELGPKGEV